MNRPQLSIALAVSTLCISLAAVGAYVALGGVSVPFAIITLIALAGAVLLSIGVLVGFARPGGLDRAEDRQRLIQAATTDTLTGLGNVRSFQEDLARELARARAAEESVGLVLLDVDGLKSVNDRQGHQAGDEMLRVVGVTLLDSLRSRERAYRIGGDEFAVILPRETNWGAFRLAQRLQAEFRTGRAGGGVSAAAGVTAFRGQDRDALVREADLALLAAKRGRRGAMIYTDDLAVREQGYDAARMSHLDVIASALGRAVDEKDPATQGHSERVSELAASIAGTLQLPPERIARIRRAGLLHDVGKVGIAEAALSLPGPLDDASWASLREHPALGRRIAAGAGFEIEATWVQHHHERVDGRGYPAGLVGSEIPLEARILAVAEAFDSMTSGRPYAQPLTETEAMTELRHHSGSQFDSTVVSALEAALDGNLATPTSANAPIPTKA